MKKKILITCGDANGVGPEIALKLLSDQILNTRYELYIISPKEILEYYSRTVGIYLPPDDRIVNVEAPGGFKIIPGTIDANSGRISGDVIKKAAELCMKGDYDAMVTMPISKEALNKGGYIYQGHTEMLTELTGASNSSMMLYSDDFVLSLVTVHIPVREVSQHLTCKIIREKVVSAYNSMRDDFGKPDPKIALLALNPHAGDGGTIGSEEMTEIIPAIQALNDDGINAKGPFPADGFFAMKMYKEFDLTVAMYHDQGLIPFKAISFDNGVNFTAGISIVRTSPDHGTAFAIAGQGIANPESSRMAVKLAAKIATVRQTHKVYTN